MKTERLKNGGRAELPLRLPVPSGKAAALPCHAARLCERRRRSQTAATTGCLGVLVVCLFALSASAQQYAVPWFKIAGGGATAHSTGGVYALSGTLGQVDTGRVAATNDVYRLESGFWAIAIQQLGYPTLNITQSGTNAVVSWITAESGLLLQSTTDLATPTAWANAGFVPVLTGGVTNAVTVPLNPATKQFFRLRRP